MCEQLKTSVDRWCAVTRTQGFWNPADPPISLALLRFAGEDPAQVTALIKAWCPGNGSVKMIEGVDVLIAPNCFLCQTCEHLVDPGLQVCPKCGSICCPF
jgi:hypothetical protein